MARGGYAAKSKLRDGPLGGLTSQSWPTRDQAEIRALMLQCLQGLDCHSSHIAYRNLASFSQESSGHRPGAGLRSFYDSPEWRLKKSPKPTTTASSRYGCLRTRKRSSSISSTVNRPLINQNPEREARGPGTFTDQLQKRRSGNRLSTRHSRQSQAALASLLSGDSASNRLHCLDAGGGLHGSG